MNTSKKIKIKDIMRDVYFVSENKNIKELFKDLQKNKHQMAIVVDEYGGTAGIITMEDILEELVGNIFDEYDDEEEEKEFEKIDDNTFMLSGSMNIFDLRKVLEVEIPEGDYDTLSGYLIELLGRIPEDEEHPEIETDRVIYKIEEYEDRRIIWVKATKKEMPIDEEDEDEDEEDIEDEKEIEKPENEEDENEQIFLDLIEKSDRWVHHQNRGTDKYGFSLRPAGYRQDVGVGKDDLHKGENGYLWSSTVESNLIVTHYCFDAGRDHYSSTNAGRAILDSINGHNEGDRRSVRCIYKQN